MCINDSFEPWVFDLYRSLPKKDHIYTIREVNLGRSNPVFAVDGDAAIKITSAEFDAKVLLEEITNGDDPNSTVKQELGFKMSRFAPLSEAELEEEEERVPALVC